MDTEKRIEPKLITNNKESSFYQELTSSLQTCNRFFFSVAFINYSGLQLLLDAFKELDNAKIQGKIITSTYLNFTDIKSLRKLMEFDYIKSKIYVANSHKGFHTKGYIFEYNDSYKIIVGSSNITQSALKSNVEWNVRFISKKNDAFISEIINEFNTLWELTSEINENFLEQYESFLNEINVFVKKEKSIFNHTVEIIPNSMQLRALDSLELLRNNNQNKALIIAATGTGKTYLAAFDVKKFNPKRVLFVVHRRIILEDAKESFEKIMPEKFSTIFQGSNKEINAEFTFAMINTIQKEKNYTLFAKDYFDYIILDEAHRSFSESYQNIINYFTPKFLLGMTATPERPDGGNIFNFFNNNIALEVRLRDALEEDLVIPFHYFGITDITTDLSNIDISKIDEIAEKLSIKERVDLIIEKIEHYGHSDAKRKCLGFCATKTHAKYMADEFNKFGYPSICLTGESNDMDRESAIARLESETNPIEFIFTVNIFNEGIDIPSINLVLMLRPTQSPIVFTQQLGRGLRKYNGKEFLTVLDFIGNHKKSFLIPIALSGSKYYDRDSLKVQVSNDFEDIPGCTNIKLDRIIKEQILNQLDSVNFNNMEYLRKEYFEFKKVLGGNMPSIIDYALYETSPDPVKFILKEGSYIEFATKMEKKSFIIYDEKSISILRSIDKMIPIKRINEFVIIKYILNNTKITFDIAKQEIAKIVSNVDIKSIKHSFKYLSGNILGENEKNVFWYIKGNSRDELHLTTPIITKFKNLIIDSLDYGILRYQEEFGKFGLNYPYLKKYTYYKMKDMGFLTNYQKSFGSIRGSGVWRNSNHFYLFVDLHKGEDIPEGIDYKDKLISKTRMQWQTQNKTSQNSDTGKDLCRNIERNIHLHMFLRKAKKIGTQKLDYIYVGKVNSLSYEGNKPITIQMEIIEPLSKRIFDDLTLIV